jgi:hypothetical protein
MASPIKEGTFPFGSSFGIKKNAGNILIFNLCIVNMKFSKLLTL